MRKKMKGQGEKEQGKEGKSDEMTREEHCSPEAQTKHGAGNFKVIGSIPMECVN